MDLTLDFARAQTDYADRLAYANAHLHKEVWSAGPLLHAEPFDFERLGFAPGKPLSKRPVATKNKYCYWLDEHDTLLAIRKGTDLADQFYDEFFFTEDGLSKSCLYSYNASKMLINVKVKLFKDDLIKQVFSMGKSGARHETYCYENEILARIVVEQWEGGKQGPTYEVVLKYQSGNLLEIVHQADNGYREVRYKAKQ